MDSRATRVQMRAICGHAIAVYYKNATKLGLPLQTSSHIAQLFSLTKSVISQILENASASEIFQYQV
jgi:hypothetical protein